MKTKIALRYENAIVRPRSAGYYENTNMAATICAEMMNLGFIPSEQLLTVLRTSSDASLDDVYTNIIPELRNMVGSDVEYRPMYPNFPQQVINASDIELYLNAIVHYLTCGQWTPDYYKVPREVAFERVNYKQIGVIEEHELNDICTRLITSNDSISESDKQTIKWFIENNRKVQVNVEIPFKENLCYVAGIFLENNKNVTPLINTATDVLRIAAYLSDGDISLAEPTKYKSLPRSTRQQLVDALARVATEEDIARYRNRWIKLFHNLHVGDYSKKVYDLAKKVRNNEKIQTFNGRVQEAIDNRQVNKALGQLTKRPGEFARRVDHMVRISRTKDQQKNVIDEFLNVADGVPTRVLLQVIGHFSTRNKHADQRIVFPKGNVQRAIVLEQQIEPLPADVVQTVTDGIAKILVQRFSQHEPLGNVWVDPQLADCPIPTQMRSASESLNQVARGTRLPFGDAEKDTLRFFIYWIGRDIDLSATFHDENFNMIGRVSYTQLRNSDVSAYHSGDIVDGRDGACEFIDINTKQAANKARYVAMNVLVFSGPTFAEHEKVYAGWMTRSKPRSNEVFEPTSVEQKVDLTAQSRNSIPVVFDLVTQQAVWTDLNTKGRPDDAFARMGRVGRFGANNVEANRASIEQTAKAIIDNTNKVSLYELFMMHGYARGTVVDDRDSADVVFGLDGDVTPYNIDVINSQYVV